MIRHSMARFGRWLLPVALLAGASAATAQDGAAYPQPGKTIRLVAGLAAGGSLDAQARVIAQKVAEQTGVQVIVENKPGASTMLAAGFVKRAEPDGYTLLYAPSSTFAQNPHTLLSVPYDPFKDFTPITIATRGPLVLTVHQDVPAKDVRELITWAKANPGKLNIGNFGVGTSSHVYAEAFAKAAGVSVVNVPYKGTADATRDLLEGRVQAYFDAAPTAIVNAQTGKIRILAVAAPRRSPFMKDVPTFAEQGVPGLDLASWVAIAGPAGMSPERVAQVNAVFTKALATREVYDAIAKGAYEASPSTPQEMATELRSAYDSWGTTIQRIGFQKQ